MGEYIKCPRCDLNWIKNDQGLCDVCKAELKMEGATLLVDELEDDDLVLCPVCKQNYMNPSDEMCEQCLAERSDKGDDRDSDNEDGWLREYIDEPADEDSTELSGSDDDWDENGLSLSQLQDDEWDDEDEESFDDVNNPDDDFDFVEGDEDDFDEDEEDEEDEEIDEE